MHQVANVYGQVAQDETRNPERSKRLSPYPGAFGFGTKRCKLKQKARNSDDMMWGEAEVKMVGKVEQLHGTMNGA